MVEDLYGVREALEIYTLPQVMQNLNRKALDAIRDVFKKYDRSITQRPEGRILMLRDAQFHLKIIEYAGNQAVYDILKDVLEQIYLQYKSEYLVSDRIEKAYEEHRSILKALRQDDLDEAADLLKTHIRHGKEHILNIFHMEEEMFNRHKLEVN
jgi:DNA-binding GntR family transcriptional regulator